MIVIGWETFALGKLAYHDFVTRTDRSQVSQAALKFVNANASATAVLGSPLVRAGNVTGEVKHDETGWMEANVTLPIRGPKGNGLLHVEGGRGTGEWNFSTAEVMAKAQRKKIDLVSGSVVDYDPNVYERIHMEAAMALQYLQPLPAEVTSPPSSDGSYPCVIATARTKPELGTCATPAVPVQSERFELDLRYGTFVLRETDLAIDDVFPVRLTRAYSTNDWISGEHPMHAFGMHSNHSFDRAPLGTRNPYTEMEIVLEDGNFIHFPRISKGTGYADAVYMHGETSSSFHRATLRWNGDGWTLTQADGTLMHFPESYNAKNLAQGALVDVIDPSGNRLECRRDGRRNLQEIRTPHERFIRFSYDTADRITRAEDDRGNWATYEYGRDGYLAKVARSDGTGRQFVYDGQGRMTQVNDEHGRTLLRNYYFGDDHWITRQDFANGETYRYEYHQPRPKYYAEDTDVITSHATLTVHSAKFVPNFLRR